MALCEGGFGYDMAMIAASIADLTEDLSEEFAKAATLLHRQIKYGLTGSAAIAFHEAGFADRHVATFLGAPGEMSWFGPAYVPPASKKT